MFLKKVFPTDMGNPTDAKGRHKKKISTKIVKTSLSEEGGVVEVSLNKIKRICKFASRFCRFIKDLQGFY